MRGRVGRVLMVLGMVLVVAALSLFLYNQWEASQAGSAAEESVAALESLAGDAQGAMPNAMTEVEIDGYYYIGYLTIPVLDLELPVMTDWSYEQLRISPCRYAGATFSRDFVIAAHNYSTHFGQIKTLLKGDDVYFTDMDGVVWHYQVALQDVLEPTAIEEMTDAGYDLTLFTCTYGGQSRITVRCTLIEEDEE